MELGISFEKAEWNNSPFGNDKECVIVRFPNCSFRWMPTYKQLEDIKKALDKVEQSSWGGSKVCECGRVYNYKCERCEVNEK